MLGVVTTLVSAGRYKTELRPGPLSDEARAHMQSLVDNAYEMFVGAVAKGRGVTSAAVRNGFGEGRIVSAQEALRLGMVDRIATLDETIARLAGRSGEAASARALAPDYSTSNLDLRRRRARAQERTL